MKAVAAARQWWAARQRRREPRLPSRTPTTARTTRVSSLTLMILAAAVIGCAASGAGVTQFYGQRFAAEQHATLRQALDELRGVVGDVEALDAPQVQLLERWSRLHDLRFDAKLAPPDGREIQSLQDARGRIAGWFSWSQDRALIRAMNWLWGLTGALGFALLICAAVARHAGARLAEAVSSNADAVREPTSEDALVAELKTAIAHEDFTVHYQPIVAADGSGIVGVEALLRWMHASRGVIAPSEFIPIAEQNGLMGALGAFALRRALHDAARWPDLFVAVNVSPLQIRDPQFGALVRAAVGESKIAPSRLVLEVTEGVVIDDPDQALRRLDDLRALGIGLALDDFGTGYSSLGYLQKFPFQRLKIDRAFVASLGTVGNAGAIIQSIVTLGHALGMSVLAEGIETDEQRVLSRLAGCDELQGFLFAPPSPASLIDAMVARPTGSRPWRAVAIAR
jgi:EAL domain-containing protein (putative c-di-GMP-specific phosphodiesterase class I)